MANKNPSRDSASRQQSAERSQTAASQQGTGAQSSPTHAGGQGQYGQDVSGGQGRSGSRGAGRESAATGTSTWQGGRQSGGALQTRGGSSMSPYQGSSFGYGSGPFSMMRRISDEMDRLFESFGLGRGFLPGESGQGFDVGGYGGGATSMWSPHVEVCERNGKLLIQADLPGMKRDDIHVRVQDDEVIIQGERRQEQSNDERGYYRSERSYGSFYRTIPLPEGTNAESATAILPRWRARDRARRAARAAARPHARDSRFLLGVARRKPIGHRERYDVRRDQLDAGHERRFAASAVRDVDVAAVGLGHRRCAAIGGKRHDVQRFGKSVGRRVRQRQRGVRRLERAFAKGQDELTNRRQRHRLSHPKRADFDPPAFSFRSFAGRDPSGEFFTRDARRRALDVRGRRTRRGRNGRQRPNPAQRDIVQFEASVRVIA